MVLWLPCPCGLMGFIWVSICITPPLIDWALFPTFQKCRITLLSFSNIAFLPFFLFWWMLCPLYRLQIILFCMLLAFFKLSHFWERSIFSWVYMHVWGGMYTLECSCLQCQKRGYWMSYLQKHSSCEFPYMTWMLGHKLWFSIGAVRFLIDEPSIQISIPCSYGIFWFNVIS